MLDGVPPAPPEELDRLEREIDGWLRTFMAEHPEVVAAIDREPAERRWFVRMRGEEKDFTTVWLTLQQRALHAETYVLPAPEENEAQFYEHLLRRNRQTRMLWFTIGDEDAVFLVGQVPLALVDEPTVDRILGSMYQYVEAFFRPALRIGFASRFKTSGS